MKLEKIVKYNGDFYEIIRIFDNGKTGNHGYFLEEFMELENLKTKERITLNTFDIGKRVLTFSNLSLSVKIAQKDLLNAYNKQVKFIEELNIFTEEIKNA